MYFLCAFKLNLCVDPKQKLDDLHMSGTIGFGVKQTGIEPDLRSVIIGHEIARGRHIDKLRICHFGHRNPHRVNLPE